MKSPVYLRVYYKMPVDFDGSLDDILRKIYVLTFEPSWCCSMVLLNTASLITNNLKMHL